MYNPAHLNECEKEKKVVQRKVADTVMTGIGLIASVSSIPQVIKIIETESVAGISLTTQIIALFTVIAWLVYGIYINNKPLMITTAITSVVLSIVVAQILIYT